MDLYFTKLTAGQWSKPQPLDFANTPGDDQCVSASSTGLYLIKEVQGQHSELVELLFPPEVRPGGMVKIEGSISGPVDLTSAFVTIFDMRDQRSVYATRPAKDGSFVAYALSGGVYEASIDPEKDNYTFFSRLVDLRNDRMSVDRLEASLGPASTGSEVILEGLSFKPNSSQISETSAQELRRLTRMIQGNPSPSSTATVSSKDWPW